MNTIARIISFFLCSLAVITILSAQESESPPLYPAFPDAEAVIADRKAEFSVVEGNRGMEIQVHYHVRIHILEESGVAYADVVIPYYAEDGFSSISKVEGLTSWVENDEMKISKLQKDQVFRQTVDSEWNEIRFSLPNAKPGAMIEYSYIKRIRSIRMFSFYFQQELPVLKSSLTAQVPDWIGYAAVAQGGSYEKIKNAGPRKWVYENGEAIQDEAFVSGIMDYADKLMFQLDSYLDRSTGRVVKVSETWESLTKEFFAEKYLSRKYAKDKDVQAMAQVLCAGLSEPEEKMIRLYRYVRNRIAFNGDRSIVYRDKLSDVLEAGEGSSAAINLLLREMLQGVGIEASPVLISTRNHGRVFKDYPMINQFNHLICYAKIGEEEHFLDATNPFRPYDLLAFNDLNGLGWLLDKQNPKWVQIPDYYIDRKLIQGFLTITPQGGLKGEINIEVDGYIAQSYRSYLARNDEEKFLQRYFKADLGADVISSASISNADQPDKSMKIVLQIDAEQYIDLSGTKAYFNPLLTFGETENPFLEPERKYPIDFVHQKSVVVNLIYSYPENWKIEDQPANTNFKLPNNELSLAYFLNQREGAFDLSNRFRLKEVSYPATYYPALKKLYDAMIARHGELIVFTLPDQQP